MFQCGSASLKAELVSEVFFVGAALFMTDVNEIKVSARALAAFVGISPRTIGRFEEDGIIEREHDGKFHLRDSTQDLLIHFMTRERWAFRQLRRFRILDDIDDGIFPELE